jgi:hypothetical protein
MTAVAVAVSLAVLTPQPIAAPELLVGVAYSAPASIPDAVVTSDLRDMRRAGYNILFVEDPASRDRLGEAAIAERIQIIDGIPPESVRIKVGSGVQAVSEARIAFWEAIATGTRNAVFEAPGKRLTQELRALGETAGIITRNQALFMPMRPRTAGVSSIEGGGGAPVDVKLMESRDALVIVALNRATAPRKVTITFNPDIPEAIWQNMESGTSIDFVMSQKGPVFDHTFGPRDALVLMTRKRFRLQPVANRDTDCETTELHREGVTEGNASAVSVTRTYEARFSTSATLSRRRDRDRRADRVLRAAPRARSAPNAAVRAAGCETAVSAASSAIAARERRTF